MYYILNDENIPVKINILTNIKKWVTILDDQRMILKTIIDDDVTVSTVFLGLDHNTCFGDSDNPIVFETMIFGGKFDSYINRYSMYKEAKSSHQLIVKNLKNGLSPTGEIIIDML